MKAQIKPEDVKAAVQDLPGVTVRMHMNRSSFMIGKKVFAFMRPEGVAMKLPAERIESLGLDHLVMGKRAMKEWAVVKRKKDLPLVKEAVAFLKQSS